MFLRPTTVVINPITVVCLMVPLWLLLSFNPIFNVIYILNSLFNVLYNSFIVLCLHEHMLSLNVYMHVIHFWYVDDI